VNKLCCALFDLDNTLYPRSSGLWEEIGRRINLYMVERLGIDEAEVSGIRDNYFKSFGTTLNALRRIHSVDPDEFLNFVHDIPLQNFINPHPELDQLLGRLKLRKVIFTNADAKHARRVLRRLGIIHHFEFIIDIHMIEFINKPERRSYLKALEYVSLRPEECLLLEDLPVNILPARELGMTTILVGEKTTLNGAHYHIDNMLELDSVDAVKPFLK
jgi:putative hydrolase of the HAD superfamily